MKDTFHKALGVTIILGVSVISTMIALVTNRPALKEIPAKTASILREIVK